MRLTSSERRTSKARPVHPSRTDRSAHHLKVRYTKLPSFPSRYRSFVGSHKVIRTAHPVTMAFRASLRPLTLTARSGFAASRGFHSTRPAFVSVGDAIPNLEVLTEGSPANKLNLRKEFGAAKGLIIGVPGAFSKCYSTHDGVYWSIALDYIS